MKEVSNKIKDMDEKLRAIDSEMLSYQMKVPNMLHVSVPVGKSENDNIEIRS